MHPAKISLALNNTQQGQLELQPFLETPTKTRNKLRSQLKHMGNQLWKRVLFQEDKREC